MYYYLLISLLCVASALAVPVDVVVQESTVARTPFKDIGSRIINGSPAAIGQFPWQVALYRTVSGGTSFCGGALISPTWVLTAAHCAKGVTAIRVEAGMIALNSTSRVTRNATRIIIHESYTESTLDNDIAVVQLASAFPLSSTIATINLASSALGDGSTVTISGYGRTSDSSVYISQTLNYVSLTTISNSECSKTYGTLNAGVVCCSGVAGRNICNGDSGGPLITGFGPDAVHVGTVSFGSGAGCTKGYPSAYSRTATYRSWIRSNTGV